MNAEKILDMIGDAKGKYIWDVQQVRSGGGHAKIRKLSPRKIWFIAAMIALMLLLVGCAVVYMMRMWDLKIGEHTVIPAGQNLAETTEVQLDVLSLQGIKDSAQYLANQEWLAFTQSYEPELGEYWESDERYWAYNVLNQVMVDKLDEICEKYGLNVIGKPWHEHVDCNQFLPLTGVNTLLKADSGASLQIPQGRFFPGGSFTVYGFITPPGGEQPLELTYHCVKKDVFYDVFAYVNSSTATERNYTTKDGIPLLLVQSDKSGMILADREDCFLSLSVGLNDSSALEAVADQFDFTIQTTPIDAQAAEAREQASIDLYSANDPHKDMFVRATYGEYVQDLLWMDLEARMAGFAPSETKYAFYDLDGNGTEELLIIYDDGSIRSVVGMKDGKTNEGKGYNMILCQDNVLIHQEENYGPYERWYHIFRFANNDDPVFSNPKERSIVRLAKENGIWWRTSSTDHYADFDTQITEEEAMEILNSYTPVTLDVKPLTEFEEP